MIRKKEVLLVFISLFVFSCASTKYLGTKQPELSASACSIETQQCFMSTSALDSNGARTSINGSYFLEKIGGNTYSFRGSVKLDHEMGVIGDIQFFDLIFVFFKDDLVVHEEKVRLRGTIGEYLEFSRLLKSDVVFDSSKWAWYNWRATE